VSVEHEVGHSIVDRKISVKVHYIALNTVDPLYVYNPVAALGRVVGSDIAGTVDKLGDGVSDWNVGDRVAGLLQGGKSLSNISCAEVSPYVESDIWQSSTWRLC
jgi:NADPH:quinone reductase-like Zn-dependent oxidoreductase